MSEKVNPNEKEKMWRTVPKSLDDMRGGKAFDLLNTR
jgi:hypothetical protein